ncbi:transcription factor TFIIIB component B'' homolog isoform X2 [Scyliorhinus canicula]|uniref:transcription factor TFIIIB component B'' homolog isoform X2 n=1 Tax=Scyliorhinus canicula TaxID=7830 RepID=UPI0018F3CD00|nr:transcription factor TFIIIB component B'' homolog isoform X2 [Scyliorhinus canicula]
MFRRSRLSIKPNVKPGGRGSSQTAKEDDKAQTSVQQPSPERKASNEKDASESRAVLSVPPAPLPNSDIGQEEKDDPDEQQENVPVNRNDKNDKVGESGVNSKLSMAPLQRRKRFSTMPNLAKPRSTSVTVQPSSSVTPKSPPRQQSPLNSVSNAVSIQGNDCPSQTSTTDKPLLRSQEKRKPSSGQDNKLPEKRTPIPQVPQFSPVKNPVHKDSTVGTNSARLPMARKTLSTPLKERITPSNPPTKRNVPSPSHSPARPKAAKIPSDLERLRKARKLRELLKEELKKEKKARRETVPIWETGAPPERTKMTMRDFIYYLPDTNPMLSSFEEEKRLSFPVLTKEPEVGTVSSPPNEDEDEESDDAVLGPRVKVAEDGTIIIDDESLTVEVLRKKGPNIAEESDPIFERGSQTTYSSFRKSTHTKPWSNKETDMFFLAISMVGTDFSMIGQLFPNRTRVEIKNKFKREEKMNSWRIDKAFKEKKPLDLAFFGELLTRVLEVESKRKKERNEKTKSQAPRKKSMTKRNRKGKQVSEIESDPDDPDPVEAGVNELVEADPNAVVEANEAPCRVEGQEDAQENETISKLSPTKRKRKRKKKVAAELAVQETDGGELPREESGSQEPKQEVLQCKKDIQKSSTLDSGQEDDVGEQIAEGEAECPMVTGEISTNQGTSENKRPSETKRKEKRNDKSLSDHGSVALSEETPPVGTENATKPQHAHLQKPKPNLKVTGRKKAGGKGSDQTASEALASYDDAKENTSDKVKESSVQDQDAPDDESSEINDKVSEKEVSSAPIPEAVEADKIVTEELLASNTQDSGTESCSMEKPEESRGKPGLVTRSRFQKPKPNLGRAVVKKDVSTDERKRVAAQEKAITTKEATTLSPNIPITEGSNASEVIKTGSDICFSPEARMKDALIPDNIPIQEGAVHGPPGAAIELITPVSESKAQTPEAAPVPSNSVELPRQSITALDTEISRRSCRGSNKVQQSERTFECDSHDEHEDLKLDSIQESITSKPTRSGRQPRPPAFYKSTSEQKPSTTSTLLSEGENEDKGRSRRARSQKAKPKVSKGFSKKAIQTKNAGKGQGASKMRLVTLRASQEEDDDDEPELVEDDDIYLINPEEVNKAPAFVPIGLRSPEPIQTQVEETMEELEIAVNVSDKNYDSETEQSFPELPEKSDPSQSCTLAPEDEHCHQATADQIQHFVEVIEIASEDTGQEDDHRSTEAGDGLQDAVYTDVSCVDPKNVEQDTELGSDPPSMQIVVCDTAPDVHTESSRLGEQSVPTAMDLKYGLDFEEPSLSKEDSCNASFSSSVIEQSGNSQKSRATRRGRFLKPKPNLSKTTPRSHAEKLHSVTQNRAMQNSAEPSGTTLQNRKHSNETKVNLDDPLQLHLIAVEGDEQNLAMEQVSAEQPNDKVSIPEEQDNCVGNKEHVSKTEHRCDKFSLPEQQDNCTGHGKQQSRAQQLDDEAQSVVVQLSIPEQQDICMGHGIQLSRTGNLDHEAQPMDAQLSIPEQQDRSVGRGKQLSRTKHLDDETQPVGVQLSIPEQEDISVGHGKQLSTKHLDDEALPMDVQLSIPEQEDIIVGHGKQLSTKHLDDEAQPVDVQLTIPEQQDICVGHGIQLSWTGNLDDEALPMDAQLSIPEQQDSSVGRGKQLSRTKHLDDETQPVDVQLSIPEQQDKSEGRGKQLSRTWNLDDEDQPMDAQLSIPEQQDRSVGHGKQRSSTKHLEDAAQPVDVQLSIPEQQDKYEGRGKQLSRTGNLDDLARPVGVQLSIPGQQDEGVGHGKQLSRTEHLDDEAQPVGVQLSIPEQKDISLGHGKQLRTKHLDDEAQPVGVQLSRPEQQDKCVGHGKQLSRAGNLDNEVQPVGAQLSLPEQQDTGVWHGKQRSRIENLDDEAPPVGVQLSIPEQQDKCVGLGKQLSSAQHLGNQAQSVVVQLSIPEQQDICVGLEKQLRTKHLDDEAQPESVQLSIPEQQDICVGLEKQLRTKHLDDEAQSESVQLSIPEQQDICVGLEKQLRTKHLDDETQPVGVQLSIPEQHNKSEGHGKQLSRIENLDDEAQPVDVQLSIPEQHAKSEGHGKQLSRIENLDDEAQPVDVQLSIPEQHDKSEGHGKQLSRIENLDDEAQPVDVQLSIPEQQDICVEDEEQMSRTKHLDTGTEQLSNRVLPERDQPQATNQSPEARDGFYSSACFTQSTSHSCEAADAGLSIEAPEMTTELSYVSYSQKIGIIETQNVEHQEILNTSEENLEYTEALESSNEETFVLTLVEIPAFSLTDYNASSTSFFPVSEDNLMVAEPVLPLSTENVEVTESVSSEPSMEATTVCTVSESVPLKESIQQQWSLNKPGPHMGQMDRKRKVHSFSDNQDFSAKKSPTITSIDEGPIEKVRPTEETTQSNLVTWTSFEECPASAASNTLRNYGAAQMNLPSESTEDFTSTPLDNVMDPAPVESTAVMYSVSAEEMRTPGSQIRRGKLTVKPNISTRRATCIPETNFLAKNKNTLKLSRTIRNTPPCVSKKTLQPELTCNLSVDMNSALGEPGSVSHNPGQIDAQEVRAATESVHSAETLAAGTEASTAEDTNTGTTGEQSEMSTQNTTSTSVRSLTRPGRKPRGFLSFISKKSSENESETKPQRTKFLKPRMNVPRFAGKRTISSGEDAEEGKTSSTPPAKRKSCDEAGKSQPFNRCSPTEVLCNSSLQSWQSESYTEEACCAVGQDTGQMQPTRVAEYFFSDIFTEMDEEEQDEEKRSP